MSLSVDSGPWLHGTDTPFTHWSVPPPPKVGDPLSVTHTAVFLTKHEDYALAAGRHICKAFLTPHAKVLTPSEKSHDSEKLRKLLLRHPMAIGCTWLRDEDAWRASWVSGEVMRFEADIRVLTPLISRGASLLQKAWPTMPHEALLKGAMHNITRGWIEEIVKSTRSLGFDAVQGCEIDRHAGGVPIARPWLAVFNSGSLSTPIWLAQPMAQSIQVAHQE